MPYQGADQGTQPSRQKSQSDDSRQGWIAVVLAVRNIPLVASGTRHGVGIRAKGQAQNNAWDCPDQEAFQRAFGRVFGSDLFGAVEGDEERRKLLSL